MSLYSHVASPVALIFLGFLWAVELHDPGSIPYLPLLAVSAVGFGTCAVSVELRAGRVGFTWRRAELLGVAVAVGVVGSVGADHEVLRAVTYGSFLFLSALFGIGVWFDVSSDPTDDGCRP